ncbi:MAG TPA: hypothetical protein VGR06_05700 [Actinophytocola sp.]|jgi:hypothetical protein|uniref:hypothetical protein n=1 Tax=Actinophytocola sp. TaxID=1872138 RepID=UPI002E01B0ED|nr:hypothetical protein [Actinophytocola sp.]
MNTDQVLTTPRVEPLEPVTTDEPDPLAKITLTPRGFAALLATIGLLLGLILAIVPVHVAGPDPANPVTVSCGNTIGGVEPASVAANLNNPDRPTMTAYVTMCETAISNRTFATWPMFLAGALTIIWMGVVRRESKVTAPASPGS